MNDTEQATAILFAGKDPAVEQTYRRLLEAIGTLGPFTAEPKKTSIHLLRDSGFAGVHPRKGYLILNVRTDHAIDSPRIAKTEQVSKNRYHNELKLAAPDEVDAEIAGWLREAYALG